MNRKSRATFTLSPTVLAALDTRGDNRSETADRTFERYESLLASGRRSLRTKLTEDDLRLIVDALNGTLFSQPESVQMIPFEIRDSLDDGLAEKWGANGPALVEVLKGLSLLEQMALADAVERFWHRVGNGEVHIQISEALK